MQINSVQVQLNNSKVSFKEKKQLNSYLEPTEPMQTADKVKPLPPKGYLIKDNLWTSTKYFFKDIGYDIKSIKDGYKGTANDHQSGRLNDVGLRLGGIGIATYLASQTTNPKVRLMEYVGLGTFLVSMSLYPKIAINLPARMRYGFDIDKQYIDDQGRKKSVMQDANYIPFDMYLNRVSDEDLSKIGDKLGIPKNVPNRNEVVKDEMRKKSIQNNTLWMLTAGVTPAITALACSAIENYIAAPDIERYRETKYNNLIKESLSKVKEMSLDVKDNSLSNSVKEKLLKFKDKSLSKEAFEDICQMLTENLDTNISNGIRKDLKKILFVDANAQEAVLINKSSVNNISNIIKNSLGKQFPKELEEVFVLSESEIESVIKKFTHDNKISENSKISLEKLPELKNAISDLFKNKMSKSEAAKGNLEFFETKAADILSSISASLKLEKFSFVDERSIEEIVNLAKVLGDFKDNYKLLDKCKSFKFEHVSETTLARTYEKFEKALLKELKFSYKELKLMRESERYTEQILDKKITELCNDPERYQQAIKKLGKIINDMEVSLHGEKTSESLILDLVNAIEMNYNKTAQRLDKLSAKSFKNTIRSLINDNVNNIKPSPSGRGEIFDMLDGLLSRKYDSGNFYEYVLENYRGVGSSKNNDIMRIIERYQGAKNSLNRILHTLDVYKRALNPGEFAPNLSGKSEEYIKKIIALGKEALLKATSSKHTLKLDTVNNPLFYNDLMEAVWAAEAGSNLGVKQKGLINRTTLEALKETESISGFNLLERFQYYISRFKNLVLSNGVDFTKPEHISNTEVRRLYTRAEKTRNSFFNLIGKTPVDFVKEAANRKYNTQKWVRTVSAVVASICGLTLLAQFGFKKYTETKYIQEKQVSNDEN